MGRAPHPARPNRRSALKAECPIAVVPNPIDLQVWAPIGQRQAHVLLQLPLDCRLVLFGTVAGTSAPPQGCRFAVASPASVVIPGPGTSLEQLDLVVFSQTRPAHPHDLDFPIHDSGRLHDDLSLRQLYAAAVFVIPCGSARRHLSGRRASGIRRGWHSPMPTCIEKP